MQQSDQPHYQYYLDAFLSPSVDFPHKNKKSKNTKITAIRPLRLTLEEQSYSFLGQVNKNSKKTKDVLCNVKLQTIADLNSQQTLQTNLKNLEKSSSFKHHQLMKKLKNDLERPKLLQLLAANPHQKMQSLKYHLKTMRKDNESYLKGNNITIQQKIKSKVLKTEPERHSPYLLGQNTFKKISALSSYRPFSKLQKYNHDKQVKVIKNGINVQPCRPLNFSKSPESKLEMKQFLDQQSMTKTFLKTRKMQTSQFSEMKRERPKFHIKEKSKRKNITKETSRNEEQEESISLSPIILKNVIDVLKQKQTVGSKKRKQINIETDKQLSAEKDFGNNEHKRKASIKITQIDSFDENSSRKFIKGSLFGQLMKRRESELQSSSLKKSMKDKTQRIQSPHDKSNLRRQYQSQRIQQKSLDLKEFNKQKIRKKGVQGKQIIISNKNIPLYKQNLNQKNQLSESRQHQRTKRITLYFEDESGK